MRIIVLRLSLPLSLLAFFACGQSSGPFAPDVVSTNGADTAADIAAETIGTPPEDTAASPVLDASLATSDQTRIPLCRPEEHGAVVDGTTPDTAAIQAAIDRCHAGGGGKVLLGPGTYYSGSLILRDGITFSLMEGAVLLGSTEPEHYTERSLLFAEGVQDLIIEGPGTIDGNGPHWWLQEIAGRFRPARLILIAGSSHITVRDIRLQQSPRWTLHLLGCDHVLIERVTIRNLVADTLLSPNTDGIDLEACRHVRVRDCDIETGDDAIVLKNGDDRYQRHSYDIEVSDCTLSAWANAFKIGTESERDFSDIVFRDSLIRASVESNPGTRPMGGITLVSDDGAHISNVLVQNVHMSAVRAPFFLRLQRRLRGDRVTPGTLSGITLTNVTVDDADLPGVIMGIQGHPVGDVTLRDVHIVSTEGGSEDERDRAVPTREDEYPDAIYFGRFPAYGLYARHVAGPLAFQGEVTLVTAVEDGRPAIVYDHVGEVEPEGLAAETTVYDRTGPER